jgi:hypothetical protein
MLHIFFLLQRVFYIHICQCRYFINYFFIPLSLPSFINLSIGKINFYLKRWCCKTKTQNCATRVVVRLHKVIQERKIGRCIEIMPLKEEIDIACDFLCAFMHPLCVLQHVQKSKLSKTWKAESSS